MPAINPIGPVEVVRDENGYWWHRGIPPFEGGEDPTPYHAWLKRQGLELKYWGMDSDLDDHPYFDGSGAHCLGWNPAPPGPEWFMLGIFDTEDGPHVHWARPEPKDYAYSTNGEDWTADWDSFLSQNDDLAAGDECQRGVIQYADPAEFVDSDSVIDAMATNAASSDLGEWADDFPTVSAEAKQEREDLLDAWARKNCDCTFYRVKNIETFTIAVEDLEQEEVTP